MGGILNLFKRKCDNCGKKLKLFERTYTWWSSDTKLKYCEKCHNEGIPKEQKQESKELKEVFRKGNSSSNFYICNECDKNIPAGSPDAHFCLRCRKWYCAEHAKNHHCVDVPRKKAEVIKEKECPGFCTFCKKKINSITGFFCKYCKKWFCAEHRLPENHKCKGNLKSPSAEYRVIYNGKTTTFKK